MQTYYMISEDESYTILILLMALSGLLLPVLGLILFCCWMVAMSLTSSVSATVYLGLLFLSVLYVIALVTSITWHETIVTIHRVFPHTPHQIHSVLVLFGFFFSFSVTFCIFVPVRSLVGFDLSSAVAILLDQLVECVYFNTRILIRSCN